MKSAKRNIVLFFAFLVVTITCLIIFTVNKNTLDALKHFKANYIIYILGIWMIATTLDALIIIFLTKGAGEKISLLNAYKLSGIRILFNIITPFNIGGQPFMVYYLSTMVDKRVDKRVDNKITPGKGASIVLTKVMITSIFVLLGAIVAFIIFFQDLTTQPAMNVLFLVLGIVQLAFILLIAISMLKPKVLIALVNKVGSLLHKMKIVKDLHKFRKKVILEAAAARKSFRFYFRKHKTYLFMALICAALMYFAEASLFWVVLKMLNVNIPFLNGVIFSILMFFILSFIPTPGGLGLGEAIIMLLFSGTISFYILGVAIILWRFFYQFLTALIGFTASAGHLYKLTKKEKRV